MGDVSLAKRQKHIDEDAGKDDITGKFQNMT
jgi:hypothetical protein